MEENNSEKKTFDMIKVSNSSDVNKVAGAIASMFKETGKARMKMIGVGAVNQAIKSVIIARSFLISSGIEVSIVPSFSTAVIFDEETKQEKETTAIEFKIVRISD